MRELFLLLYSRSVMSDSLQPHGLQHKRLPYPSPTPRACSNSCPLSHCSIQPSHPLPPSSPPALNLSQHQGFSSESTLRVRWPKYWSFSSSISPSHEYSGLISFRVGWFDLLSVPSLLTIIRGHSASLPLSFS